MNDDTTTDRSFIERLYETITQHLSDEQYSVEQLSRDLGVSKTQLHRKLQLHIGKSASQLIREARLKKAKDLLKNKEYTAAEVAYQVGFNSPTYFNSCFHDFYGYPPGEVKHRQNNKKSKFIFSKKTVWISISALAILSILYFSLRIIPDYSDETSKTTANNTDEESTERLPDKSIAVLPFENLSDEPGQEYFCNGMVYEILDHLVRVGGLTVKSGILSEKPKNINPSNMELGKELGVSNLLRGSVRRQGNDVRITAQVVDVWRNTIVWSNTYEGTLSDIFTIQANVAQRVANALKATLTTEETELIAGKTKTSNSLAYDYYLRGNEYWNFKYNDTLALEMYSKAIAEDSTFSPAYARRASMHAHHFWLKNNEAWIGHDQMALADINKGYQLDPGSYEVKFAEAIYHYMIERDYDKSINILNKLKKSTPNKAELYAYTAYNLRRTGKWREAIDELSRAIQLDPFNAKDINNLSTMYFQIREYDKSIGIAKQGLEKFPDNDAFKYCIFRAYIAKTGDLNSALKASGVDKKKIQEKFFCYSRQFDKLIEYVKDEGILITGQWIYSPKLYRLAYYYYLKGNLSQSKQYADSTITLLLNKIDATPNDSRLYTTLGICYALKGEIQKAIFYGKKGIDLSPIKLDIANGATRESDMIIIYILTDNFELALYKIEYTLSIPNGTHIGILMINPIYDPLRSMPRFQEIINSAQKQ